MTLEPEGSLIMEKQFWALSNKLRVGPYPTREEALGAFRCKYPRATRHVITTGYGSASAWFDLRFHQPVDGKAV